MDAQVRDEIYSVLRAYHRRKQELDQAVARLEQEVRAGLKTESQITGTTNELYALMENTPEFKEYNEMHKRALTDHEFEHHYRPIYDEVFKAQ